MLPPFGYFPRFTKFKVGSVSANTVCHSREGGNPQSANPKNLDARLRGHDMK